VLINIQTLEVMKGSFPRRAMVMVLEWANEHRDELMEAWNQGSITRLLHTLETFFGDVAVQHGIEGTVVEGTT
jgi:hypothetical protein